MRGTLRKRVSTSRMSFLPSPSSSIHLPIEYPVNNGSCSSPGQDECRLVGDDKLDWKQAIHLPRHAHWETPRAGAVQALSAGGLIRQAFFVNKPIFLGQWRF